MFNKTVSYDKNTLIFFVFTVSPELKVTVKVSVNVVVLFG